MDTHGRGKLLFICGKMAAGKSTLSKELAAKEDAVHLAQDAWTPAGREMDTGS